jgi:hypothetical protein
MVRKVHFWPQTSHLVPVVLPQNPSKLQKISMLSGFRLSPQFSPLFPCTSCGKPVPSDRRFWLPFVVTPGRPAFQAPLERLVLGITILARWLPRRPIERHCATTLQQKMVQFGTRTRDLGGLPATHGFAAGRIRRKGFAPVAVVTLAESGVLGGLAARSLIPFQSIPDVKGQFAIHA